MNQLERLMAMLEILVEEQFFGRIEIVLNGGRIVHVVQHKSVKIEDKKERTAPGEA